MRYQKVNTTHKILKRSLAARERRKKNNKENLVDVEIEDEESLIHDLQAQKLLQLLDESENYRDTTDESSTKKESSDVEQEMSEPYLTEVDELEEEEEDDSDDDDDDDDDDVEELEAMRQASKSTKRDHFSKLRRRLRQLGKMFMNQEVDGERKGEKNKIEELQHMVDSLKDGHIKQLEQEVKEWTKKLLSKDIFLEMDEEDLEEEEQRLGSALSSLMDALDEAENKLSTAMKGMETLGEFLDSRLKEMESSADESQDSASEEPTQQDGVDRDSQDPIEGMSQAPQNPEDPVEETSSMQSKKNVDKVSGSSRQLRIVKHKMEDESHKTKLEQKIKDRLQKLGLEKIGRKFEVKILTPNSLEDEDTNNPLLSQEETEAFQNMIVNLLSANAEELEERENHRKLEKNYGFKWDDSQFAEDEEE
ncbi:FK506-binding protein 5-like [Homarus americanus]|uniref:FK506-binding protein 5-like n=1 Tax=Homarus americanus TaxID=6706 RepID=UPI001C45B016|nr:FK506-binding protein 5-like [Homarus americanus]XP_042210658.1 FK506-binding protein 5-like [Homarus americanus]XP_042210659.1 FK506-binding protein 5-like [Homarus americanus]XP_042210660.1 FK506-binding protein 5-like [Homarus americanus]XP_042210661.1 FK506-binding protein 5-like [Homarus americanus]XP_042210662.1 FK506-binding protein 5-like [Homarus americanus]XP_042210663.1 FK506-binding protein 5-like [Homarus americanus]XP_042210664.1 FK506-binding protein 5-like [Homarus america